MVRGGEISTESTVEQGGTITVEVGSDADVISISIPGEGVVDVEVEDGVARGYNRDDKLVAEVPLTEPAQMRPAYDRHRKVYRLDVT